MSIFLLFLPVVAVGLLSSWAFAPTCASFAGGAALFFASASPLRHWFVFLIRPLVIPPPKPMDLAVTLVDMANTSRKDGILALEGFKTEFPPLRAAKNHCVDGIDPDSLTEIMERERRVVTGQIMELLATLRGMTIALCLMFLFLMANIWWHGQQGDVRAFGGGLFLVLLVYILLRGRLERLVHEMDEIYRMITDGIVGIQKGMNPRMLMTFLQSGIRFDWRMADDSNNLPWKVTAGQVEEQLAAYLVETHPQVRRVNVCYDVPPRNEGAKPGRFCFNDLILTDDRSFEILLREITDDEIVYALKGTTPEMVRKAVANMSPTAAEHILFQLKYLGIPKDEAMEKAQSAILKVARQLEAEGCILVVGSETIDIAE